MEQRLNKPPVSALGVVCIILAIILTSYALTMDVSVHVDNSYLQQIYKDNPGMQQGRVVNMELLSQRQSLIWIGCTLFIAGVVLIATAQRAFEAGRQLLYAKANTRILSLMAATAGVEADYLNAAIKEAQEEDPLLFEHASPE